jgi:cyclophilin family peptidyl-prolyl cis-trans isomerase/HEAT repeat protein
MRLLMKRTVRIAIALSVTWLGIHTAASAQSIPPGIHARVVQLEDERNLNGGELATLLNHTSPNVRERAALAIGRIGDKRGTAALIELLQNERDERVRAMAAFALGEIEDAQAVPALMAFLEPGKHALAVRERPAEALGKIASVPANTELLGKTIIEQINGRLIGQLPGPKATLTADKKLLVSLTITALMRLRSPASVEPLTQQLKSDDADVRAQAANALARIRQPIASAVPALIELLNDRDADARANAVRALGASKDARAVEPLIKLLNDKSEQVRTNTVRALAAVGDKRAVEPLLELLNPKGQKTASSAGQASTNLSLEIAATLGVIKDERSLEPLIELRRSFLPTTVPEVEIAIAKLNEDKPSNLRQRLNELTQDACHDWNQATIAAQTIGALLPTKGNALWDSGWYELASGLLSKVDKPECDQRSLPAVLRTYGNLIFNPAHAPFLQSVKSRDVGGKAPEAADFLPYFHKKLQSDDVIVRAAAAAILGEQKKEESFAPLVAVLAQSKSDTANDAKLAILTAISKYKSEKAIEAIKMGSNDSDHLVRRHAIALLKEMGAGDFSSGIGIVRTGHNRAFYPTVVARMNKKVTATIQSAKGAITMELFPQDAPITVDSFVTLARRGYFNNLTFHRVVPNFDIQGGDPRGDGEGGPGYQIRCEVNTRPYVRGAVGMALSGKDTGGSQFFITHSPQPHLDGGYTVFGQVTGGMEVVDRIARGDRIEKVVIVEK